MNNYQKLNRILLHHKKLSLALIVVTLALIVAKPVWRVLAAPGALDTTFSGDGRYTLPLFNIGSGTGYARLAPEVRVQLDPNNAQVQRVIVPYGNEANLACFNGNTSYDFLVIRLTTSGVLDTTFGVNGMRTVSFAGISGVVGGKSYVTAMELQSDGKILLVGQIETCSGFTVGLARLTFNGALDTTFGEGGRIVLNEVAEVYDMAVSSGKIILVGKRKVWDGNSGNPWMSAIWRFNANGTPDTTFSSDGLQTVSIWADTSTNNGGPEGFKSVQVQSDGKIAVLNSVPPNSYRLRRFNSNGSVDNTLQANGLSGEYGNTIRAGSTSIWVIGAKETQGERYGAIFSRSMSNGSVDTTYGGGTGSVVWAQPSEWSEITSIPFSFPARFVVGGWNTYPSSSNPLIKIEKAMLAGYSATGVLNTNFGTNGSVETVGFLDPVSSVMHPHSRYYSIRTGLNGKIVAGGMAGNFDLPAPPKFGVVAQYLSN